MNFHHDPEIVFILTKSEKFLNVWLWFEPSFNRVFCDVSGKSALLVAGMPSRVAEKSRVESCCLAKVHWHSQNEVMRCREWQWGWMGRECHALLVYTGNCTLPQSGVSSFLLEVKEVMCQRKLWKMPGMDWEARKLIHHQQLDHRF